MRAVVYAVILVLITASIASAAAPSKVTLDVRAQQLKDVANDISQQSGVAVVLDPKATGTITASLKDAELTQALDVVTKITGLTWRKMQFAKATDAKVPLEQLKATALALASLPLVGLSVEDPSAKTSAVYAKNLTASPDVASIKLPEGYSWTTVYVILPSKSEETAKDSAGDNKIKAVSDAQAKTMAEMANMTPEERQMVFRNEWLNSMNLSPDVRQSMLRDRMQAISTLGPTYRDQLRQDMRAAFGGMRGGHGGRNRQNGNGGGNGN